MLQANLLTYVRSKKTLLKNFSFTFNPGKIYGVVGLNGSGKTTLLKVLSGIWRQSSGSLHWNHKNLDQQSRLEKSRLITMVPQTPQISFDYSVRDIIAMGSHLNQEPTSKNVLTETALQLVHAQHLSEGLITRLSSGERQRVFIARSLATGCPVLLLDEPTASLDIKHQMIIWSLLKELRDQGKTIIVCTHALDMAETFCDEILHMSYGSCVGHGKFDDVITPECELFS